MAVDIEWTGIVGGTDTGDDVENKLNLSFQNIEDALNALFVLAEHGLLLEGKSGVNQLPAGLGDANAIQVSFGGAQTTEHVSIDANGTLTFNTTGTYSIRFAAHFGRTGASGTSLLAFRALKNDVQFGSPQVSKLDNAEVLLAWSDMYTIQATAGDTMKGELMRVTGFDNSGGLYAVNTTEWGVAQSATLQVYKVG